MKNNFKTLFIAALTAFMAVGCVDDDDTKLPYYDVLPLFQDFNTGNDEDLLATPGWLPYVEVGAAKWKQQVYSSNGYAEFNPYQSGDVLNVGWLISPKFELAAGHKRKFKFQSAESYVTDAANKIEVYISSDFDGTNVATATWTKLDATLPQPYGTNFAFVDSGDIDISAYSGSLYVAFKVTGGTNGSIDGAYQIDNVAIF